MCIRDRLWRPKEGVKTRTPGPEDWVAFPELELEVGMGGGYQVEETVQAKARWGYHVGRTDGTEGHM